MNPLFPDDPTDPQAAQHSGQGYVLPRQDRRIEPPKRDDGASPAVELIRHKIDALYATEPNTRQELQEVEANHAPRSKHQQFMHDLSSSGKSLAEIQTAWHAYYTHLPDDEKRTVWQEFYAANAAHPTAYTRAVQQQTAAEQAHAPQPHDEVRSRSPLQPAAVRPTSPVVIADHDTVKAHPPDGRRSLATIKRRVTRRVRERNRVQLKAKQHLQSLAFGLGMGALVLLIVLFGFFNEVVIAPFIQPGSHAAATPIILNENSVAPSANPEVIIPKINVELPVVYGTSTVESDVENSLEEGVVHYAGTAVPGQLGNAAFFGHSSNNIFNKGKYKFAFVLLHELEPGDIFYLTYQGKVYTYKVFQKKIVNPNETWVLNAVEGRAATATLITCDPPGTSLHRLVVWGEQITPSPTANSGAPVTPTPAVTAQPLPGNGPSAWTRFWRWVF